jgi:putative transposase
MAATTAELDGLVSTRAACALTGRPRASHYRCGRGPVLGPPAPRLAPANALSQGESDELLDLLRSPRFVGLAPAQVWAILLDDGRVARRSAVSGSTWSLRPSQPSSFPSTSLPAR